MLSLFNIGGRFFWASLSDYIGRKSTYYCFFLLGIALYALAPTFAAMGSKLLFVLAFGIILSMYGGGFATVPAYLADMFGTQFVGAIHGRLLTAWSTAGIIGPVVVNYIREFQLAAGVPRDQLYDTTMYILCAMLVAGLICNYLDQAGRSQMEHERGRGRQTAGGEREERGGDPARLVRHRQGRAGCQGRAVLGFCRRPARLGRVEDTGKRGQDLLIAPLSAGCCASASRGFHCFDPSTDPSRNEVQGDFHASHQCLPRRHAACRRQPHIASAQTTPAPAAAAAPAAADAKPSRMKLTVEKLKEMRASWKANKPKLKACRKEVKAKGLAGDDRWFYIEDCMDKT